MPTPENLYGQQLITPFSIFPFTLFPRRPFLEYTTTPYFYVPRNSLTGQYSFHTSGIYFPNSDISEVNPSITAGIGALVARLFGADYLATASIAAGTGAAHTILRNRVRFPFPNPFKYSGYVVNLGTIREEITIPSLAYSDVTGNAEAEMFFHIYFDGDGAQLRFDKKLARRPDLYDRIIRLIIRYREAERRTETGLEMETEAVDLLREKFIALVRQRAGHLTYDQAVRTLNADISANLSEVNDFARQNLYLEITGTAISAKLSPEGERARDERFKLEQRGEGLKALAKGEKAFIQRRLEAYTAAGLDPEQIQEVERLRALSGDGDSIIFAETRPGR